MLEAITAMASVIGDPYLLMLIAVTTVLSWALSSACCQGWVPQRARPCCCLSP